METDILDFLTKNGDSPIGEEVCLDGNSSLADVYPDSQDFGVWETVKIANVYMENGGMYVDVENKDGVVNKRLDPTAFVPANQTLRRSYNGNLGV